MDTLLLILLKHFYKLTKIKLHSFGNIVDVQINIFIFESKICRVDYNLTSRNVQDYLFKIVIMLYYRK